MLADLISRDEQDTTRQHDPLRAAEDAVMVDTSGLSFEESLDKLIKLVEAHHAKQA